MYELPETNESLLFQIRDAEDTAAWDRFVAAYRPAVYRFARRRGLQDAEAEDLAQQVMISVSRAIGSWQKEPKRGTFRSWLLRIARNAVVNAISRSKLDAAQGGSSVVQQLSQWPSAEDDVDTLIADEHQRAVFRWAAEEVRHEFQQSTWLAFWLTTSEDYSVEQAAEELGKSIGSVYASRSRVMRRLKDKVRELEGE